MFHSPARPPSLATLPPLLQYEALLAYAALHFPDRIRRRQLRFADTGDVELADACPDAPYDFVACHSHLRTRLRNERALSVLGLVGSGGW